MSDVIYPTADFAADEFHQKYGFNDIKSDTALTLGAEGEKTLDQGFVMNELSKGIITYDEAHNQPAADKYIKSYNTLMDQYNVVLQHSHHPIAKLTAGIGGFISQPLVAMGGVGAKVAFEGAGLAIKGAGLSSFIGAKSAGFMANLGESRLAALGGRTLATSAEALGVTAPEALSHASLAQSTPIHDNYNYMDALREMGQNFFLGGVIHLGVAEPLGAAFRGIKEKYTPPVQLSTTESVREATGKVENQISNEEEPNARAELHQGFNDQRNSLKDPTVAEVRASAADIQDKITKTGSKINELQKEAKEPVEPTKTMTAPEIANRIVRIEAKPETARTPLEKKLLKDLPKTEIIENLKKAMTKHENVLTSKEANLVKQLQTTPEKSIRNERAMMMERGSKMLDQIAKNTGAIETAKEAGNLAKARALQKGIKDLQPKVDEFTDRFNALNEEATKHNEPVLQKIDKLEDSTARMADSLGNHLQALDVLQQPKESVSPQESATKPLFYSDTDPISESAEKVTPEEEISGIPEGIDIKEADFSEKGKEDLETIRDEKKELPNYKKLMQGIVDCITTVFYR